MGIPKKLFGCKMEQGAFEDQGLDKYKQAQEREGKYSTSKAKERNDI